MTPPSVSKKAIQANRVPVWGLSTGEEKKRLSYTTNKNEWRKLLVIDKNKHEGTTW